MSLVRPAWPLAALGGGLALGIAVVLERVVAARFLVRNRSMLPTLQPGDRLLMSALSLRLRPARRGDLVVLRDPERTGQLAIKRLAGLPGEPIPWSAVGPPASGSTRRPGGAAPAAGAAGRLLTPDELLVVGDNRAESRDSRAYGPISRRRLVGRAWYRYWPPERRGRLEGDPATTFF